MNSLTKTIAAVSTPRGRGGIAVIRISGDDAIRVAGAMFKPARMESGGAELSASDARRAIYGAILDSTDIEIDRGMCTVFVAPHSFTGENSAEISCHGGPAVTEAVYLSALAHGAVAAGPGEFTKRAFVSGKLSLTEAEAVGGLIDADTNEKMRLSGGAMRGNVSREIERLSASLFDVMTALYAAIDYPEEDVGDEGEREIAGTLSATLSGVEKLLSTYKLGRAIQTGVRTTICGKPNVGKSSLFNLITGEDSADSKDIIQRLDIEDYILAFDVDNRTLNAFGIQYVPFAVVYRSKNSRIEWFGPMHHVDDYMLEKIRKQ